MSGSDTDLFALGLSTTAGIPNSPLPLLIYRGVVAAENADPAAAFERLFAGNGWVGAWRNGIYGFPHYHTTAHEVLGIARGWAQVRFGGERPMTAATCDIHPA